RRAAPVSLDARCLTLAVHNAFAREWLLDYYKDELEAAGEKALGSPRSIEIRVDPERVVALLPTLPCVIPESPAPALPAEAAPPRRLTSAASPAPGPRPGPT